MESKNNLSAIPAEEFAARQQVLDIDKWLASERAGRDLCGTMSWCAHCVKAEVYPCAKAKFREEMEKALDDIVDDLIRKQKQDSAVAADEGDGAADGQEEDVSTEEALEEIAAEEAVSEDLASEKTVPEGYEEVVRLRRSFKSRIIQNAPVQDFYTELKNALLGYAGVKSRLCQSGENFRIGKEKIAKLVVTGKKLSFFLALPPEEFENTHYRFEDVGDKKSHKETPMRLKLTGKRSLKQAKELLETMMNRLGVAAVGCIYGDFHYAYKTDEELIRKGLIKPYKVLVKIKKTVKQD